MFLANNPLDEGTPQQGGQPMQMAPVQQQPGMLSTLGQAAIPGITEQALGSAAGTAATAAMGPLGFMAGPLLSSGLGMFFNDGTAHVPDMEFGPDPLMGYNMGTSGAGLEGVANSLQQASSQLGSIGGQITSAVSGGGRPSLTMPGNGLSTGGGVFSQFTNRGGSSLQNASKNMFSEPLGGDQLLDFARKSGGGGVFGFNDGTAAVPMNSGGYASAMQYAQGTDSVPSMLTPGEAIIPAGAAQDPANQGMIEGMIDQGRQMNQGVPAQSPMHSMPNGEMMPGESHAEEPQMSGPLSGKAKRENTMAIQDLSLKKKAWLAEEQRKQELHQQKMRLTETKAKQANQQSARQSQE